MAPARRPAAPERWRWARPCTASWSSATSPTSRRSRPSPPRSPAKPAGRTWPREAAELAGACWRAAPVRAAAASPEVYRELPIGALLNGAVVSGAVDLLYRDGDEWVIVDYKTDRGADAGVLRERYTPQGAAYAVAVEAATGRVVREVVFVAGRGRRPGRHVPVDDALRAAGATGPARAAVARERRRRGSVTAARTG